MSEIEIYNIYNDLSEDDAFKAFEVNNVPQSDIVHFLGYDVANDYLAWIRVKK